MYLNMVLYFTVNKKLANTKVETASATMNRMNPKNVFPVRIRISISSCIVVSY